MHVKHAQTRQRRMKRRNSGKGKQRSDKTDKEERGEAERRAVIKVLLYSPVPAGAVAATGVLVAASRVITLWAPPSRWALTLEANRQPATVHPHLCTLAAVEARVLPTLRTGAQQIAFALGLERLQICR